MIALGTLLYIISSLIIIGVGAWTEYLTAKHYGFYKLSSVMSSMMLVVIASLIPIMNMIIVAYLIGIWIADTDFMQRERYVKKDE